MTDFKFDFGDKVRCEIRGFDGVIYGKIEYATGCKQYNVIRNIEDGYNKGEWEDEGTLTFIEKSKLKRVPKQVERYDFKLK